MRQACARFAHYLQRRFGQSSTSKHYLSDLNAFRQTLGEKRPEDVIPRDIEAFVEQQIAAGLRPSTINRRLATLHAFFEFLAGEEPERDWPNPVVYRRHRLRTGSQLPRDVRDSDVARLFAVITDARDRAMFGLMVGGGLRVGEVATLPLDSVEAPTVSGDLTKLRVLGKGRKERIVWLSPPLWAMLQDWLQVRPAVATEALFLSRLHQPISVAGIQYRLQQYAQQAGVSLSCHRLRHTFARRLVENGLPVDSLARLLGHNQLQTTQRYIAGADPTLRADFTAAMARLESTLVSDRSVWPEPPPPQPTAQARTASPQALVQLRPRLAALPPWLVEGVEAFLTWHWPTWRAQTADHLGEKPDQPGPPHLRLAHHLSSGR